VDRFHVAQDAIYWQSSYRLVRNVRVP